MNQENGRKDWKQPTAVKKTFRALQGNLWREAETSPSCRKYWWKSISEARKHEEALSRRKHREKVFQRQEHKEVFYVENTEKVSQKQKHKRSPILKRSTNSVIIGQWLCFRFSNFRKSSSSGIQFYQRHKCLSNEDVSAVNGDHACSRQTNASLKFSGSAPALRPTNQPTWLPAPLAACLPCACQSANPGCLDQPRAHAPRLHRHC